MRNARPASYGKADESTVLSFVLDFQNCEESLLMRAVFESCARDDFFDFRSIHARYREIAVDAAESRPMIETSTEPPISTERGLELAAAFRAKVASIGDPEAERKAKARRTAEEERVRQLSALKAEAGKTCMTTDEIEAARERTTKALRATHETR